MLQERLLGGDCALKVARVCVEAVLVAEHLAGVGVCLHNRRLQRVEGLLTEHALQGRRCSPTVVDCSVVVGLVPGHERQQASCCGLRGANQRDSRTLALNGLGEPRGQLGRGPDVAE